jgi:RimJ/RimL family protein N-acetyltransferase
MLSIQFEKATKSHIDAIYTWLEAPRVKEFWDNTPQHREDILLFVNGRKKPSPYAEGIFTYWIGSIKNEPYCLLMTSEMLVSPDLPEYYLDCLSKTGKTYSIDFMIGNKNYVGKGLGAPTLEAFMKYIRANVDNTIDRFMIDPEEDNTRAKHVYEKAGFQLISEFVSTKGSGSGIKHYLMIKDV